MKKEIARVAQEISDDWKKWKNKKPMKPIDEELLTEYYLTLGEIKDRQETLSNLREAISEEMKGYDEYETDFGLFYFMTRKKYKYSPTETKAIDVMKRDLKAYEKDLQKDAAFAETKTLAFRKRNLDKE